MRRFALIRPTELSHARALVEAEPETRQLRAGGIDLIDRMKEGLDEPDLLVELRDLGELAARVGVADSAPPRPLVADHDHWTEAPRHAQIGALTSLAELAAVELPGAEAASMAAGQAATPSIRNTATVAGNLLQRPRCWYFRSRELVCLKKGGDTCLALTGDNRYNAILGGGPSFIVHPSSVATALLALDASAQVYRGPAGAPEGPAKQSKQPPEDQLISLERLFVSPADDPTREHSLGPGEILTSLWVPLLDGQRSAYQAVREKQSHDWPLVEAAVRVRLDGETLRDVRVALGHVAPIPWLSRPAAEILEGQTPSAELFAEAAEAALAEAKPLDGNAYKIPMTKGLLREVLHRACDLPLPE